MKRIQLSLILLLFPLLIFANDMKQADRAFDSQEYWNALLIYHKLEVASNTSKADKPRICFQIAECNRMLSKWQDAKNYYTKALNLKYPDDKARLYLAQTEQMMGEYQQAIADFTLYQQLVPSDPAAQIGIDACNEALAWINTPSNRWHISNETDINTKSSDFCPTWSDRRHTSIVISSKRPGQTGSGVDPISGALYSDLFEAKLSKTGKWSTPSTLQGDVNLPTSNDGASCITKNGTHIYFTRCDQKKKNLITCKIFYSEKKGNAWDVPVVVDFDLDAATLDSFNFRHPAVSANEEVMVFSSDMRGTTGGVHSDLWISTFDKKTKKWTKPVNMGNQINTQEREGFPYISDDGTLYFSSDGRGGMGGLDIYRAPRLSPTEWKWGQPENMKVPFNSPADDFGIVFDGKKKEGYLTSNREGTKGMDDIWKFYYQEIICNLKGVIHDCANDVPVSKALVELIGSDGSTEKKFTNADGSYNFKLHENVNYIINVYGDSAKSIKSTTYFSLPDKEKGKLSTLDLSDSKDYAMDFCLPPIPTHDMSFPAVLYDLDKATLRPESKDSLNYLYQILIDNPNLVIELDAHTDCRGSADHNRALAQSRAQSCVDYLISKGISKDRLVPKGYGEDKPLKLPNGTVLTEKYINSQPAKDREALHQLNRRTTFKVLRADYVDPKAPARGPLAPVNIKKGYYDESGDEISDGDQNDTDTPETSTPK